MWHSSISFAESTWCTEFTVYFSETGRGIFWQIFCSIVIQNSISGRNFYTFFRKHKAFILTKLGSWWVLWAFYDLKIRSHMLSPYSVLQLFLVSRSNCILTVNVLVSINWASVWGLYVVSEDADRVVVATYCLAFLLHIKMLYVGSIQLSLKHIKWKNIWMGINSGCSETTNWQRWSLLRNVIFWSAIGKCLTLGSASCVAVISNLICWSKQRNVAARCVFKVKTLFLECVLEK